MTLKSKTFSAVRWTAASALFRALLQFAQIAVLARLLSPEDFGLMAIVTVILAFALLFADLGLTGAYVQHATATERQRSSIFWLSLSASIVLSILIVATAPVLATFFGDPRLTSLIRLTAVLFVFNALAQQLRAVREKELDFRPVAAVEVAASLMGFVVAVLAAINQRGVYSLIFGSLANSAISACLSWVFLAQGWRPRLHFRLEDVKPYLAFGSAAVLNGIAIQIHVGLDLLLGGRLLGATQLGYYSIPRNLVLQLQLLLNPIVTRVGFPLIAHVQQDSARVRAVYSRTANMTASVNAPLYIGMGVYSQEIAGVLLGGGWAESATLLKILALWGFFRSTINPAGSLLYGMGRPDVALKWNLGMLIVVPPILWLGSQHGAQGLAAALLLHSVLIFVPAWYVLIFPLCRMTFLQYAEATLKPLVLALSAVFPVYWVASNISIPELRLILGIPASAAFYLVLSRYLNNQWIDAIQTLLGRRSDLRLG